MSHCYQLIMKVIMVSFLKHSVVYVVYTLMATYRDSYIE